MISIGQEVALDVIAKHARNEDLIDIPYINLDEVEPSTLLLLYRVFEDVENRLRKSKENMVKMIYQKMSQQISEENREKYNNDLFKSIVLDAVVPDREPAE